MIHGNSTDPVIIKKISLRMWKLRDEIESVIEEKENGQQDTEVENIRQEYSDDVLASKINEDQDKGLAEFAEADEAEDSPEGEEESTEETQEAGSEDSTEEASEDNVSNVLNMADDSSTEESEPSVVKQRRPMIPEEKVIKGISILSEITMDGVYLFCNKQLLPGQSVVVDFVVPNRFVANAEVVFCRPYNMKSRIISENKMPFRCAVRFNFLKEGERTLLRQFLESIEPDLEKVHATNKVAEITNKAADDDLGDLDDLDL